ncbi:hypothetical protein D3C85_1415080 [compost metagenome]
MLGGQAVGLILVDRHGDEQPFADMIQELFRLRDVLEAVPAGNRLGVVMVRVVVTVLRFQPRHRLGIHIEAHGAGIGDEAATADADIDYLAGEVLAHQVNSRLGQRCAHRRGVEQTVFIEVRTAVVHRRPRVVAHAQLVRPEQAVGQPMRQSVRHSRRSFCHRCAASGCSGRSCPAPRR